MSKLTQAEIDELQRKYEAATPGEWLAYWCEATGSNDWADKAMVYGLQITSVDRTPALWKRDADFIAAAHNNFPALIDAQRQLVEAEQKLARVREILGPEFDKGTPAYSNDVVYVRVKLRIEDVVTIKELLVTN